MYYSVIFDNGICITDDIRRTLGVIQRRCWTEAYCFYTKVEAYLWACQVYAKRCLATLAAEEMPICPMPTLESFDIADEYVCTLCPYVIRPAQRYFGIIAPNEVSIILENIDELAGVLKELNGIPFYLREFETKEATERWIQTNLTLPLIALGAYIPQPVQVFIPDVGERVTPYSAGFDEGALRTIADGLHRREDSNAAENSSMPLLQPPLLHLDGAR